MAGLSCGCCAIARAPLAGIGWAFYKQTDSSNASKRAARRLRRSAACAAGRGDADGVAESDDDNEAESDDVRARLEKLEAMEHGEVDWDDDDVYSLGWGQSWSSVDHLA